jgi:hypothetical protein
VTASRTAARLLRCFPRTWRARYAEELEALVVDMSDGRRVSWRTRADLVRAGGREQLRAAGLGSDGTPDAQVRGGVSLVLWAWALFVFAGAVVQKTSEHWQSSLPGSHPLATIAFDVLIGTAVLASVLVLAGIAVALPSLRRLLRKGGWSCIHRRIRTASIATVILIAATVGLVLWAHGLTAHQRAGADAPYASAVAVWALLGLGTLLTWTRAAVEAERCLHVSSHALAGQATLAAGVAGAMTVMTAAAVAWWIAVAQRKPAALTGSHAAHASAAVPQLILATALMLLCAVMSSFGAWQATRSLPGLTIPSE